MDFTIRELDLIRDALWRRVRQYELGSMRVKTPSKANDRKGQEQAELEAILDKFVEEIKNQLLAQRRA